MWLIMGEQIWLQHIVVMRKGLYYKVDVYDKKGNILTPQTLEEVLEYIVEDADKHEGM